jgi:hypothetical protein
MRQEEVSRVLLAIALMAVHCHEFLISDAASVDSIIIERLDADTEQCGAYERCVQSLKQLVGGKISFYAMTALETCLVHSMLECSVSPAPWFGLAAVMGAMGNSSMSQLLCRTGHRLAEAKKPASHRNSRWTPLLSIVLAGRADSYHGDPMKRACVGLRSIAVNANAVRIPTEVVFVDYNPPNGSSVAEVLSACIRAVPRVDQFLFVRVIAVPLWVLQISAAITQNGELPVFNEMVAKNVGIRRASGSYVISSNPEVVFPSSLWLQFARNPGTFFRARTLVSSDRRDSWPDIDARYVDVSDLEKKLDAGVRVVWSHLHENGTTLPRATDRGLAPLVYFDAVRRALNNCPWQELEVQWQGNGTELAAIFIGVPTTDSIHHTAAGDFIMAHRAVWLKARGFFDVWSLERPPIDSLTISKMVFGFKMRQMVLRGQYAVWHYSDEPFKYKEDHELIDIGKHNRVYDVPASLTMFFFFKWISYHRSSALAVANSCTWGMCSPFSALEIPFNAERLFRCGGDSSDSCFKELAEFSRMCPRTIRYPIRSFDFFLMPTLQSVDKDMSVAAAIANFGCLLTHRNNCADDQHFSNISRAHLTLNSCCANINAIKLRAASPLQHHASSYLDLEEELRCDI